MSRSFSDHIFHLGRYVHFLRHSTTRYSVHSPYIYELVTEVIRPGAPAGTCSPVEDIRKQYLRSREKIVKTDRGSGASHPGPREYPVSLRSLARSSSIPSYRAARLFHLVRFLRAGTIVELGTALGISAGYMGKANPAANILTLEGCPELAELARKNLLGLGLDRTMVVEGDFSHSLPVVLDGIDLADLVFFDGDHRREPTLRYFDLCLEKAGNETVFVFDDIHYSPEMEQAWERIKSNDRVTVSIDLFHMGIILFRQELSRQHFILRYP